MVATTVSTRIQLLGQTQGETVRLHGLAQGTVNPWSTVFASPRPYAIDYAPMELMNERLGTAAPLVDYEVPVDGDLLNGVLLQARLPKLAQPEAGVRYYKNGVGIALVRRAELLCKGRVLDRVEQQYIYLNHEVHGTQTDESVGLVDRVTVPELADASAAGRTVTLQIPFFFARGPSSALPIHRARERCERLQVRLLLTPLPDLVVNLHCAPLPGLAHSKHDIQVYGRAIWLGPDERVATPQTRLITSVSPLDTHGAVIRDAAPLRVDFPFGGPVKCLLFGIADDNREVVSDLQDALVPFPGNDVRRLTGKFAALSGVPLVTDGDNSTVSDYNSFDPGTETVLGVTPGYIPSTISGSGFLQLESSVPDDSNIIKVVTFQRASGVNVVISLSEAGKLRMWKSDASNTSYTYQDTQNASGVDVAVHVTTSNQFVFVASGSQVTVHDVQNDRFVAHSILNIVGNPLAITFDQSSLHLLSSSQGVNNETILRRWNMTFDSEGNYIFTPVPDYQITSQFYTSGHMSQAQNEVCVVLPETSPVARTIEYSSNLWTATSGSLYTEQVTSLVIESNSVLTGHVNGDVVFRSTVQTDWEQQDLFTDEVFVSFVNGYIVAASKDGNIKRLSLNDGTETDGIDPALFEEVLAVNIDPGRTGVFMSTNSASNRLPQFLPFDFNQLTVTPGRTQPPSGLRASSNVLEHRRDGRAGSLMIPGDPFEFRAVDAETGTEVEPLDRVQMYADGREMFSAQCTHNHFRGRAFNRAARRGVYAHSYATDPSGPAHSGTMNFTRVNNVRIVVYANSKNTSRLFLYAEKYNLLQTDSRVFSLAHPV